jgi:hypothetical protein
VAFLDGMGEGDGFRVPACSLGKEYRGRVETALEGFLAMGCGLSSRPVLLAV